MIAVAILLLAMSIVPGLAAPNGLARTPPRGWSSWNNYHRNFSSSLFRGVADALVSTGLRELGFDHVHVDGGWWEGSDTGTIIRNASGFFEVNAAKIPEGMGALVSYIHSRGLLWAHYTDAGTHACNRDAPMSEGYEARDAALFASWNIDMLKVDACGVTEPAHTVMSRWASLLNATGRPILLSNCHNGCMNNGSASFQWAPWCADELNMWRTSGDIKPTFVSMVRNLDTMKGMGAHGAPGGWNDPDLLEIGIGEFAWAADGSARGINEAHYALWCVTSSPLIIGFDIRSAAAPPAALLQLVSNKLALRVNSEYAGNAGDFLRNGIIAGTELWAKPLRDGAAACVLFNRNASSGAPERISVAFSELPGLHASAGSSCLVTRVYSGQAVRATAAYAATVDFHGVDFIVVQNCTA
jgi:alpha-galactosidase